VPVKVERHKRHLRVSQARTGSSKNFIVTSDNPIAVSISAAINSQNRKP
jgi:hypothetical protein